MINLIKTTDANSLADKAYTRIVLDTTSNKTLVKKPTDNKMNFEDIQDIINDNDLNMDLY